MNSGGRAYDILKRVADPDNGILNCKETFTGFDESSIFLMESQNGPVALITHLVFVTHSLPVISSLIFTPLILPFSSFSNDVTRA